MASAGEFEQILGAFLGNDNAVRRQAEAAIAEMRKQPDNILTYLTQYMRNAQVAPVRSLSAVLLRKMSNTGFEHGASMTTIQSASPQVQAAIRSELLAAIENEPEPSIRRQCADTIAAVANCFLENNQWPELLPKTLEWARHANTQVRDIAMFILGRLAEFAPKAMQKQPGDFYTLVQQGLSDSELTVRCAAMQAAVAFVIAAEDSISVQFESLLPQMLQVIEAALNAQNDEIAEKAISALADVAGAKSKFLKSMFGPISQALMQIGNQKQLEAKVRALAVGCVITMAETGKGKVRDPAFVKGAIELTFSLLVEVEDNDDWLQEAASEELEDIDDPYYLGLAAALSFSSSVGGKVFLPAFCQFLPQLTASQDWKQRHAALMAISQIGESCAKQLKTELAGVLQMVLPFMSDPHPRVVNGALQLVGVYCQDLAPDFQSTHHAAVVPAIMAGMNSPHLRIKAQAAAALVNFCGGCEEDTIDQYVDGLLQALVALLQLDAKVVQGDAVTALSQIACHCSRGAFSKYYDAFMPGLKTIIERSSGAKDGNELQGKALECMSLIGLAAGKEKFAVDACQMMGIIVQTISTRSSITGDVLCEYMLKAIPRICEALGEDFAPFMPQVMPVLLRSLALDTKMGIVDVDDSMPDEEAGVVTQTIGIRGQGEKRVSIHIEALSEKIVAAEIVTNMCLHLKQHYFAYLPETLKIMVPLLTFFMEEIRHAAMKSLPELMRCGILYHQAAGQSTTEFAQGTIRFMLPQVLQATIQESDTESLSMLLENFAETVQIAGENIFTDREVATCMQVLRAAADDMLLRRQEIEAALQDEDADEKEFEDIEEDLECEFELQQQVGELMGALIRSAKGMAVGSFDEHMKPLMGEFLAPARRPQDHMMALCAFDDIIEHGAPDPRVLQYAQQVLPSLIQFLGDKDTDVRQSAAYGVGVCAVVAAQAFAPVTQQAFEGLNKLIADPEARSEENSCTTDNAISAMGKIAFYHSNSLDANAIVPAWLGMLPLKEDRMEAKASTELIAKMVESRFAPLLANPQATVPQILTVLADAVDTETSVIQPTIHNLQQLIPADVLQAALQGLAPAIQQQLASCA